MSGVLPSIEVGSIGWSVKEKIQYPLIFYGVNDFVFLRLCGRWTRLRGDALSLQLPGSGWWGA